MWIWTEESVSTSGTKATTTTTTEEEEEEGDGGTETIERERERESLETRCWPSLAASQRDGLAWRSGGGGRAEGFLRSGRFDLASAGRFDLPSWLGRSDLYGRSGRRSCPGCPSAGRSGCQ
jgi:hypothetical protein